MCASALANRHKLVHVWICAGPLADYVYVRIFAASSGRSCAFAPCTRDYIAFRVCVNKKENPYRGRGIRQNTIFSLNRVQVSEAMYTIISRTCKHSVHMGTQYNAQRRSSGRPRSAEVGLQIGDGA